MRNSDVDDDNGNLRTETTLPLTDPMEFWIAQEYSKGYRTDLPIVAQDILAIVPTSVPSERTFSVSGVLSQNRYASITPANLERRVLIKCNKYL